MRLEHLTNLELIRACQPETELEKLLLERLIQALADNDE